MEGAARDSRPHLAHSLSTSNINHHNALAPLAPPVLAKIPADIALHTPTPITTSPQLGSTAAVSKENHDPEAGPSHASAPHGGVQIPPPPNPRRHRSGVLMSRVRAHSGGTNFKAGGSMPGSKSWGDLSLGLSMTSAATGATDDSETVSSRSHSREGKRIASDPHRRPSDDEDGMWDNSARFYHHMHSRPASRSTSPDRSPASPTRTLSTTPSASNSPIYARRASTLPHNGPGPPGPPGAGMSASLSPNHHFLQQHLPPTFRASGPDSPEQHLGLPHPGSMVILTPTTQEWRELKEIGRIEGEDVDISSSGSSSDDSRRSSLIDTVDGLLLRRSSTAQQRPSLKSAMSVDYLPGEAIHTPDPGSPVLIPAEGVSPERPVFNSVIIAPSPVVPENSTVPQAPDTPTRLQDDDAAVESSLEIDEDQPIVMRDKDAAPARFNSIGRRESLAVVNDPSKRPGAPRAKTKRELERERLFKNLDEELELDRAESQEDVPTWNPGVQEIGKLAIASPGGAETSLSETKSDIFDKDFSKAKPLSPEAPLAQRALPPHLSPSQPLRPSPLHSSPVNAANGLPTPDESPLDEKPLDLPPPAQALSSDNPAHKLDTIRDYAKKNLVQPHPIHHHLRQKTKSRPSSPSPPHSPRTRKRDINRVSLVAGRVVQPYAIPASTALPPQDRPPLHPVPSLQSFSPFRSPSPSLSATKGSSNHLPPLYRRFDSSISIAASTTAPSECGTPTSETAGGLGGRGIEDYVILKEAGKGAYGLVMRAKVKGPKGEPIGDEVIIKYIIKARILADCWKKHKQLGPIPVEIHVMDQLRHLLYNPPLRPHPWDPARSRSNGFNKTYSTESEPKTPDSPRSDSSASSAGVFSPTQKYIASEIKHSPERGHPNICKLLDFFEDREFYYLVMPRFGTGVDLFDRVESQPDGLEPFEVRSLLGQLADAVRFLHNNGIVHRDIKDENVILDGSGKCQLIDFGSAAHWRPGKRWDTFSGTLHYASPEILRGEMYSGKEQDVWALGVVGYVLLVGETPFSDLPDEVLEGLHPESGAEVALEERCGGASTDEGLEADGGGRLGDAADLVRRCLEQAPADRPSAEVICQHRYLKGEDGWVGKKGWIGRGWK